MCAGFGLFTGISRLVQTCPLFRLRTLAASGVISAALAAGTCLNASADMELAVPAKSPWRKLIVRAYAVKDEQEGIGVATVELKKP